MAKMPRAAYVIDDDALVRRAFAQTLPIPPLAKGEEQGPSLRIHPVTG